MGRTNRQGVELIQSFEQCRLRAYPDPGTGGEPWTIGWGHTGPDVYPGLEITQDEADGLFVSDLASFEADVESCLEVESTGNQYSALVCFAYNCKGWHGSILLRKFNTGDIEGTAAEFGRWTRAGGRVLRGLVRRREAERELFLTPGDGEAA